MEKPDTVQMSQDILIKHPIIKVSEDHFRKNKLSKMGDIELLKKKEEYTKMLMQLNIMML